jgi:hypothetical protein
VVGEKRNSQILVKLPVTDVPRCTSSNAKTLGLKHLLLPDMASSSESPHGARVVHQGHDELPAQQNTVPVGNANPPAQEITQHLQSVETWSMREDQVSRLSRNTPYSKLYQQNCQRILDTPASEEHRRAVQNVNGDPPFSEPKNGMS